MGCMICGGSWCIGVLIPSGCSSLWGACLGVLNPLGCTACWGAPPFGVLNPLGRMLCGGSWHIGVLIPLGCMACRGVGRIGVHIPLGMHRILGCSIFWGAHPFGVLNLLGRMPWGGAQHFGVLRPLGCTSLWGAGHFGVLQNPSGWGCHSIFGCHLRKAQDAVGRPSLWGADLPPGVPPALLLILGCREGGALPKLPFNYFFFLRGAGGGVRVVPAIPFLPPTPPSPPHTPFSAPPQPRAQNHQRFAKHKVAPGHRPPPPKRKNGVRGGVGGSQSCVPPPGSVPSMGWEMLVYAKALRRPPTAPQHPGQPPPDI